MEATEQTIGHSRLFYTERMEELVELVEAAVASDYALEDCSYDIARKMMEKEPAIQKPAAPIDYAESKRWKKTWNAYLGVVERLYRHLNRPPGTHSEWKRISKGAQKDIGSWKKSLDRHLEDFSKRFEKEKASIRAANNYQYQAVRGIDPDYIETEDEDLARQLRSIQSHEWYWLKQFLRPKLPGYEKDTDRILDEAAAECTLSFDTFARLSWTSFEDILIEMFAKQEIDDASEADIFKDFIEARSELREEAAENPPFYRRDLFFWRNRKKAVSGAQPPPLPAASAYAAVDDGDILVGENLDIPPAPGLDPRVMQPVKDWEDADGDDEGSGEPGTSEDARAQAAAEAPLEAMVSLPAGSPDESGKRLIPPKFPAKRPSYGRLEKSLEARYVRSIAKLRAVRQSGPGDTVTLDSIKDTGIVDLVNASYNRATIEEVEPDEEKSAPPPLKQVGT
ncbi:hypothetical protein KY362_05635 [Candidatus Woesearchaeota archaeon]|nr:hypothetical protein [Candidatus Woesearchaeota archaeon]